MFQDWEKIPGLASGLNQIPENCHKMCWSQSSSKVNHPVRCLSIFCRLSQHFQCHWSQATHRFSTRHIHWCYTRTSWYWWTNIEKIILGTASEKIEVLVPINSVKLTSHSWKCTKESIGYGDMDPGNALWIKMWVKSHDRLLFSSQAIRSLSLRESKLYNFITILLLICIRDLVFWLWRIT